VEVERRGEDAEISGSVQILDLDGAVDVAGEVQRRVPAP
jgi:hypothetical protein